MGAVSSHKPNQSKTIQSCPNQWRIATCNACHAHSAVQFPQKTLPKLYNCCCDSSRATAAAQSQAQSQAPAVPARLYPNHRTQAMSVGWRTAQAYAQRPSDTPYPIIYSLWPLSHYTPTLTIADHRSLPLVRKSAYSLLTQHHPFRQVQHYRAHDSIALPLLLRSVSSLHTVYFAPVAPATSCSATQ